MKGEANTLYRVEFFSNSKSTQDEAENYLGYQMVPINAKGQGVIHDQINVAADLQVANITSTATTSDGATSTLSRPVALK